MHGPDQRAAAALAQRARVGSATSARWREQLLDHHRAQLGGKPLELRLEGEPGVLLEAPESALSVALGNLIGNAVKYTQKARSWCVSSPTRWKWSTPAPA
jgi:signal transduction histidine kinase